VRSRTEPGPASRAVGHYQGRDAGYLLLHAASAEGASRGAVPRGSLDAVVPAGAGRRARALRGGLGAGAAERADRLVGRSGASSRRGAGAAAGGEGAGGAVELRAGGRRRLRADERFEWGKRTI